MEAILYVHLQEDYREIKYIDERFRGLISITNVSLYFLEARTLPFRTKLKAKRELTDLLELLVNNLRLLVPLKPHHVLGVKPPTLLLQSFRRQVLPFRALHIVKYEE